MTVVLISVIGGDEFLDHGYDFVDVITSRRDIRCQYAQSSHVAFVGIGKAFGECRYRLVVFERSCIYLVVDIGDVARI